MKLILTAVALAVLCPAGFSGQIPVKEVSGIEAGKSPFSIPNYYSLNSYKTQSEAVEAMNQVKETMQKAGLPVIEAVVVRESFSDHDTLVNENYSFTITYVKNSAVELANYESAVQYKTKEQAVAALNEISGKLQAAGCALLEVGLVHYTYGSNGVYSVVINYVKNK
ncbi:MAG: hypothetical protein PHW69_06260 [Elusimicrobiaceae bacterium]|nr:hypothetical protein [Elusimicrobiaceae bacterium]